MRGALGLSGFPLLRQGFEVHCKGNACLSEALAQVGKTSKTENTVNGVFFVEVDIN